MFAFGETLKNAVAAAAAADSVGARAVNFPHLFSLALRPGDACWSCVSRDDWDFRNNQSKICIDAFIADEFRKYFRTLSRVIGILGAHHARPCLLD